MERGDNTVNLPRQIANLATRETRDRYNNGARVSRWKGTEDSMFRVAEADMTKVKVVTKYRRIKADK